MSLVIVVKVIKRAKYALYLLCEIVNHYVHQLVSGYILGKMGSSGGETL